MQNREPTYPGRVTMTPVFGQANTYDMERADQPLQQGTPLNKATLLKDATAALYGLGTGAVPDEVLAELGKYKQYWWRRRLPAFNGYVEKQQDITKSDSPYISTERGNSDYVYYSKTVSIDQSTGDITLDSPTQIRAGYRETTLPGNCQTLCNAAPCYIGFNTQKNLLFYLPTGSTYGNSDELTDTSAETMSWYSNESDSGSIDLRYTAYTNPKALRVTTEKVDREAGDWDYLQSSDRSAYPDSGTSGGYEYEYLGIPFDNAVTAPKIETGSYVGTGEFGASRPNTLTFGFKPKMVFMADGADNFDERLTMFFPWTESIKTINVWKVSQNDYQLKATISGNTISWSTTSNASFQWNEAKHKYCYLAIG